MKGQSGATIWDALTVDTVVAIQKPHNTTAAKKCRDQCPEQVFSTQIVSVLIHKNSTAIIEVIMPCLTKSRPTLRSVSMWQRHNESRKTNIAGSEATVRTPDKIPNQSKCLERMSTCTWSSSLWNFDNKSTKRMYGDRDPAARPTKTAGVDTHACELHN